MKKSKDEILKHFADEMQFPVSALTDIFKIEFHGANDVCVDGCRGLIEYGNNAISLNLGSMNVHFTGSELEINTLSDFQTTISGNIISMEFST